MSEAEQLQYAIDLSRTETDNRIKFLDGQFGDEFEEGGGGDQENNNSTAKPSWTKSFNIVNKFISPRMKEIKNRHEAAKQASGAAPKTETKTTAPTETTTSLPLPKLNETDEDDELKKALAASLESHQHEENIRKLVKFETNKKF